MWKAEMKPLGAPSPWSIAGRGTGLHQSLSTAVWEYWEHSEPFPFPTVTEPDTVDPGVT